MYIWKDYQPSFHPSEVAVPI